MLQLITAIYFDAQIIPQLTMAAPSNWLQCLFDMSPSFLSSL